MQCQTPLAEQLVISEEDTSLLSAQCGASALHCFLAKPPGSMKIDVRFEATIYYDSNLNLGPRGDSCAE